MTPSAVLAGVLVGVFALSGALKIISGAAFYRFLQTNFSARLARLLRSFVPLIELVAAAVLLTPFVRLGGILAAGLAASFLIVAFAGRVDSSAPSCGCFGALDAKTPHWLMRLRAAALLGGAVLYVVTVFHDGAGSRPVYSVAVGVAMGAAGASAVSLAGQVISVLGALRSTLAVEGDSVPR